MGVDGPRTAGQMERGASEFAGDACHSMLPMLAQGAVMALEDGYRLGRAMEAAGGDIEQGLARHERARRECTTKAVIRSAEKGKRFQSRTLADATAAQEYVDREWRPEQVRQRYEW
jgi:salicylate hydroxylase